MPHLSLLQNGDTDPHLVRILTKEYNKHIILSSGPDTWYVLNKRQQVNRIFFLSIRVYQDCPINLSVMMEMFYCYVVFYSRYKPHVATEQLKYDSCDWEIQFILINFHWHSYIWLLAPHSKQHRNCALALRMVLCLTISPPKIRKFLAYK